MAKLSGLVAILNAALTQVIGVRDLGPIAVEVKSDIVRPLVEVRPALGTNQVYNGAFSDIIAADKVTRTYTVITLNLNAIDQAALNAALTAEGSVFRALGLVLFQAMNQQALVTLDAVNELRTVIRVLSPTTVLPNFTVAQFKTALAAKGNTPFYTMQEFLDALQAQIRSH